MQWVYPAGHLGWGCHLCSGRTSSWEAPSPKPSSLAFEMAPPQNQSPPASHWTLHSGSGTCKLAKKITFGISYYLRFSFSVVSDLWALFMFKNTDVPVSRAHAWHVQTHGRRSPPHGAAVRKASCLWVLWSWPPWRPQASYDSHRVQDILAGAQSMQRGHTYPP